MRMLESGGFRGEGWLGCDVDEEEEEEEEALEMVRLRLVV